MARSSGSAQTVIAIAVNPRFEEHSPALSPDGPWLAYVSDESGREQIWLRPFPEADSLRRQISLAGGTAPRWAHSGRELFFKSQGALVAVDLAFDGGLRVGDALPLFPVGRYKSFGASSSSYDVAPDDKRILMIEPASPTELVWVQGFLEEVKAKVGR